MTGWQRKHFDLVVADESGGNVKTPQSEFLPQGRYAIVDQGKELIAGYTNDESRLCRAELPVIVFGDHTRCFKYVDFPFCMGADGVKVLRPKIDVHSKYLYHYFRQMRLPEGGYDRHFKYLKRSIIALPALPEQRRIAAILDKTDALRAKRRSALAQLDTLTQSIFLDMFGDPATNPRDWLMSRLSEILAAPLRNGLSPSHAGTVRAKVLTLSAITGGEFDADAWKASTFKSTPPSGQSVDQNDFLICRGNGNLGLVGRGVFPARRMPDVTFPDTMIAARISGERVERAFLEHVWNSMAVRAQIEAVARTTNGTFKVNQAMLEEVVFVLPSRVLQREFALRVAAVAKLRVTQRTSLMRLDTLFASIQHRAFRGEL